MDSRLEQAKEWAKESVYFDDSSGFASAVRVIQSLPDQIVDGHRLRQIIDFQGTSISDDARKDLESLFTPPLQTLADMTPEERGRCRWMQCDVETDHGDTIGVIRVVWASRVDVIFQSGAGLDVEHRRVTPRPDLPKLEWPGSTPDDVAYATGGAITTQDVVDECRAVRKERALPRPEDVPAGEPWIVESHGCRWVGTREAEGNGPCMWALARLDSKTVDLVFDEHVTLVSRLVPECKENA